MCFWIRGYAQRGRNYSYFWCSGHSLSYFGFQVIKWQELEWVEGAVFSFLESSTALVSTKNGNCAHLKGKPWGGRQHCCEQEGLSPKWLLQAADLDRWGSEKKREKTLDGCHCRPSDLETHISSALSDSQKPTWCTSRALISCTSEMEETDALVLKFMWQNKRSKIVKGTLKKRTGQEDLNP